MNTFNQIQADGDHYITETHLLLVAYPVGRLQAPLQEGEAQLV